MGLNYLNLPGSGGVSTPDSTALGITGDIDLRCRVAASDFTPAATSVLMCKGDLGGAEWRFYIATSGQLVFNWWDSGATQRNATSSVVTGLTDGTFKWARVTLDVDNGSGGHDVKFWLSDDNVTYTQLGTTQNAGAFTTSIGDLTKTLYFGSQASVFLLTGKMSRAQVYSGIGGTLVVDADFSSATPGASSFAESANNATVTLSGGPAIVDATPPTLSAASINSAGTTLSLTFSESVTGVSAADYALSGGATLSNTSGSGTAWTMTISPPVQRGQMRTLSYTGTATVDAASNALATFSGAAVTNNSTASPGSSAALAGAFGFGFGL